MQLVVYQRERPYCTEFAVNVIEEGFDPEAFAPLGFVYAAHIAIDPTTDLGGLPMYHSLISMRPLRKKTEGEKNGSSPDLD